MLIEELERYFADNGVIMIKFFLDSDEVRKSVPEGWMTGPKGTFLSDDHKYEVWGRKSSSKIISGTTTAYAPWDVVKVDDVLKSSEVVCRTFIDMWRAGSNPDTRAPRSPWSRCTTTPAKGWTSA